MPNRIYISTKRLLALATTLSLVAFTTTTTAYADAQPSVIPLIRLESTEDYMRTLDVLNGDRLEIGSGVLRFKPSGGHNTAMVLAPLSVPLIDSYSVTVDYDVRVGDTPASVGVVWADDPKEGAAGLVLILHEERESGNSVQFSVYSRTPATQLTVLPEQDRKIIARPASISAPGEWLHGRLLLERRLGQSTILARLTLYKSRDNFTPHNELYTVERVLSAEDFPSSIRNIGFRLFTRAPGFVELDNIAAYPSSAAPDKLAP